MDLSEKTDGIRIERKLILVQYAVPDVAKKIDRLFSTMKGKDNSDVIAKDINDILIIGDKIPLNIVSSAWDLFAKRKGVIS